MADIADPDARRRLEEELSLLRERRRGLADGLDGRDGVGDRADDSVALEQADDIAWLDDRISEISERLTGGGQPDPAPGDLPHGTEVTLSFDDGETMTLRAVALPEEVGDDEDVGALTLDSPLGRALAGARTGDTVEYRTPAGAALVEVLDLRPPGQRR